LYGFTTPGQKVEWMRANPLVCVEVDEVTAPDQWVSVIAFGRYEELPQTTRREDGRLDEWLRAYQALKTQAVWWEPGCAVGAAPAGGPALAVTRPGRTSHSITRCESITSRIMRRLGTLRRLSLLP